MVCVNTILTSVVSALLLLYIWLKYIYSFWARKNVPFIKPHLFFGNIKALCMVKKSAAEHLQDIYNTKSFENEPFIGIYLFTTPALVIRDPNLIKSVLVRDFSKFSNRYAKCNSDFDPLGCYNTFFLKNPLWKKIRASFAAVFSVGKIKLMFALTNEIGKNLDKHVSDIPKDPTTKSCAVDVKELCALYTSDVIASIVFGLEANCLQNPEADFRRFGRAVYDTNWKRAIQFSIIFFLPHLVDTLRVRLFSSEAEKLFKDAVNYAISERLKSGVPRNDLIDVLAAFAKEAESDKSHFATNNLILVAQAAGSYVGGFESSASAMAFALFELARNPEIQKRLRAELKNALQSTGGELSYELLNELPYMNMVLREVLRLYPPLPFIDRECTLSKGEESYSLKPYSDFAVPNGMPVYIPIYALQRDPKYYPNPEKFDPERFNPENKSNTSPLPYLSFGIGPKNCVGERLGFMQTRIGLANLLRNHYLTPSEKTPEKIQLYPKAFIIQAEGGIHLNIVHDPLL